MGSKRLKFVDIEDRVGMLYDILSAMASYGINISTMELSPPNIFVKIHWEDSIAWPKFVAHMKAEVKEITDIAEIDLMGYEKKEKELYTVINNINEGIVAIDKDGYITFYNEKAKDMFKLQKYEPNCHLHDFFPKNSIDAEFCSKDRDNIELSLGNSRKQVNLMADIRIIENEAGVRTGSVIILKEMTDVRQMLHSISRPSMITFEDIIGESQAMKNAITLAKSVAPSNSNIMLRGESGTGKELFVRAIHMASGRSAKPFIAINCAAVPDALLESEFFGYERGAFTGANVSGKQGLFELATHGTLFLDEIGDLSPHLQAKILRVIQEQRIRRLGGKKEIPIDVRMVCATHRDLEKMIVDGSFREDLYYRLNVIPIHIPPLRERKADIPILVQHFIDTLGKELGKAHLKLDPGALKEIMDHDWPGNVRELQNVMERAMILAKDIIVQDHLMIQRTTKHTSKAANIEHNLPVNLPEIIQRVEYEYLNKACKEHKSSREIAKALGISHTTVIKKMKSFGFD